MPTARRPRSTPPIRVRILHGSEIAMGPGKAELLAAIAATGSIAAAARTMRMSYRRAWLLVQTMNACFARPLVASEKGGRSGGGATLTDDGHAVLACYEATVAFAQAQFGRHLRR